MRKKIPGDFEWLCCQCSHVYTHHFSWGFSFIIDIYITFLLPLKTAYTTLVVVSYTAMVKIVNGVIQDGAASGDSVGSDGSSDSSTVNLCGYKVAKWMPIVGIVASLMLFGIKGLLLFSGGLFIAYIMSNGSSGPASTQSQVSNTTLSWINVNKSHKKTSTYSSG